MCFLYFRREIAKPESSTALQNIFCKIFGVRCEMGTPVWRHFPKFFKAVSMQHIATKQQWKVLNLEPFYISWGEKFDLPSFLEIQQSLWHYEVKIGSKGTKFIMILWYYDPFRIPRYYDILISCQRRSEFVFIISEERSKPISNEILRRGKCLWG